MGIFFSRPGIQTSFPTSQPGDCVSNPPSMDPKVLRDIPPSCPKQSLGLVLLASPFPPRRSWATADKQLHSGTKQIPAVCAMPKFKNLGNSRTGNSIVSHEKASPGAEGLLRYLPTPSLPPPCTTSHGSLSAPISPCPALAGSTGIPQGLLWQTAVPF